jgi:hypothetical protein
MIDPTDDEISFLQKLVLRKGKFARVLFIQILVRDRAKKTWGTRMVGRGVNHSGSQTVPMARKIAGSPAWLSSAEYSARSAAFIAAHGLLAPLSPR